MPIRLTIAIAILMGLVVAVPAATTITIIQRGLALNMASISLTAGDRLSFTNDDDVIHNIHIFIISQFCGIPEVIDNLRRFFFSVIICALGIFKILS